MDTSGVLAGKTLTQITAGELITCVTDTSGAIYCWGWNPDGQLGDDSTAADSSVPVLVGPSAPTGLTAVAADTFAAVSWIAPARLDTGTLTGYTATAPPGSETFTTSSATSCSIGGLSPGSPYSITVVAHTTVGDSGASPPLPSPLPAESHSPATPPTPPPSARPSSLP